MITTRSNQKTDLMSHLLRRASFGGTSDEISIYLDKGYEASVEKLLTHNDTDDLHEESSRIEPYFWDPVAVTLDEQARLYVLETGRHRFQVYGQLAACSTTNR